MPPPCSGRPRAAPASQRVVLILKCFQHTDFPVDHPRFPLPNIQEGTEGPPSRLHPRNTTWKRLPGIPGNNWARIHLGGHHLEPSLIPAPSRAPTGQPRLSPRSGHSPWRWRGAEGKEGVGSQIHGGSWRDLREAEPGAPSDAPKSLSRKNKAAISPQMQRKRQAAMIYFPSPADKSASGTGFVLNYNLHAVIYLSNFPRTSL